MTPEHRAHLRALAARVRTEEPSDALRDAVLIALGWDRITNPPYTWWRTQDRFWGQNPPNPLTSLDAAAQAMPEGLFVACEHTRANDWLAAVHRPIIGTDDFDLVTQVYAPTEPQARTSAALEAMAAEGE